MRKLLLLLSILTSILACNSKNEEQNSHYLKSLNRIDICEDSVFIEINNDIINLATDVSNFRSDNNELNERINFCIMVNVGCGAYLYYRLENLKESHQNLYENINNRYSLNNIEDFNSSFKSESYGELINKLETIKIIIAENCSSANKATAANSS